MKKVILIFFSILLYFFTTPFAYGDEGAILADEIDLNSAYSQCLKNVEVEQELESYFSQAPLYMNLATCLKIAIVNNFHLKAQKMGLEQNTFEYKNALTNFFLETGFTSYGVLFDGQILVGGILLENFNEFAMSFSFFATHQLTKGGEQIFEALSKKQLKYAQKHFYVFTRKETILNTTKRYYELLRAKLNIEIYQKNYKERCAQLTLTQNLLQAGLGTKFDVIRSKTELAQARQNLLNALQEFRYYQARLANVMGIEVSSPIMPVEDEAKEYMLIEDNQNTETLFASAFIKREDVKQLKSQIEAYKNDRKKIMTQFVPKPRLTAEQRWQGTARVGLGASTVLGAYVDYHFGQNTIIGTITQLKAQSAFIDKKIFELEQKIRDIKESIISSFYESKISKDRIEISKEQVELAKESVYLAELRLDAGEGILIDVITAQTFKTQTKIELVNSTIRYNIAQVQMLFDSGDITYGAIVDNYMP